MIDSFTVVILETRRAQNKGIKQSNTDLGGTRKCADETRMHSPSPLSATHALLTVPIVAYGSSVLYKQCSTTRPISLYEESIRRYCGVSDVLYN